MLRQIEERYNSENNTRPDGPPVTWAEMELYEAVLSLKARVEDLEQMRANIINTLADYNPKDDLALKIWNAIN